jgi:hypothetical protein
VFSVKLFLPDATPRAALTEPPEPPGLLGLPEPLGPVVPPLAPSALPLIVPSALALDALADVAASGHYRGLVNKLNAVAADEPQCAPFIESLRSLAQAFQFDVLQRRLADARVTPVATSGIPTEMP